MKNIGNLNLKVRKRLGISPLMLSGLSINSSRALSSSKLTVRVPSVENENNWNEENMFKNYSYNRINHKRLVVQNNFDFPINKSEGKIKKISILKKLKNRNYFVNEVKSNEINCGMSTVVMPLPSTQYKLLEKNKILGRLRKMGKQPFRIDKENGLSETSRLNIGC